MRTERASRWLVLWLFTLPALLCLAPEVAAQVDSTLIKVRAAGVEVLPGSPQTLFSEGMEARATSLRDLLARSDQYLSQALGREVEFSLAVLDEGAWSRVWPAPYGLPYLSLGEPWVAVMPASPELSVLFPDFSQMLGPQRGADMVDNIGFHEVGHVYVSDFVYEGRVMGAPPVRWLDEFLATYLAYAFLRSVAPERASIWDDFAEAATSGPDPRFTSLEDFEAEYYGYLGTQEGAANYSWYQAMFTAHAAAVYERHGVEYVSAVREHIGQLAPSTWTTESMLEVLEDVAPGLGGPTLSRSGN